MARQRGLGARRLATGQPARRRRSPVDGRLSAVIDFGGLNVGDPACDLQPAWNVFAGDSRMRFRAELEIDNVSWLRGRGWALCQAVSALAYYWDTNPGMIRQASHALAEVLADSSP
jgi:aminoglycoside phosphotransferase (APT) family kinase protein